MSLFVLQSPVSDDFADDESESDIAIADEPMVIAEKQSTIRTLTPSMAALELGLADSGVVVFHNARHGRLNVVFKRPDGNIGWVDPDEKPS